MYKIKTKSYSFFLQYIEQKPGNFIDLETGEVVGSHKGKNNNLKDVDRCYKHLF